MFVVFDYDKYAVTVEKEWCTRERTITFQLKSKTRLPSNLIQVMSRNPWHSRLSRNDLYYSMTPLHSKIVRNKGVRAFPLIFYNVQLCYSTRILTMGERIIVSNYLYGFCEDNDWNVVIGQNNFFDYLNEIDPNFVEGRLLPDNNDENFGMISEPFSLLDEEDVLPEPFTDQQIMAVLSILPPEIIEEIISKYN